MIVRHTNTWMTMNEMNGWDVIVGSDIVIYVDENINF